jgi:magnesium-transporting ATPase (P-type)
MASKSQEPSAGRGAAASIDLGGFSGLSEEEARTRLEREGLNELPTQKKRRLWSIVLEVAREPMFLMLVVAGGLYLFMGEPTDTLMLLGFVFVVMAITIVQERRTEHALDALRDLSSPRASSVEALIDASLGSRSCRATSSSWQRVIAYRRTRSCGAVLTFP